MNKLASGDWLTRSRVTAVASISGGIGAAMVLFLLLTSRSTLDIFGQPIGTDFTAFWHAGVLANQGQAASAWDPRVLNGAVAATHHAKDYTTAWHYPPLFLLIASPLAYLPYLPALIVAQALSLAAIALVLRAILPDRHAVLVALASPITAMILGHGQNSFLTAALLGSGLLFLRRRQGLAGVMLGALAYKPPLALVIAPFLLLTRTWKAIASAIIFVAILGAVSVLFWGTESWFAFFGSLDFSRRMMEQGIVGFYKFASLFAAARMWGASVALSYAVQALGLMFAFLMIWRVRGAGDRIRAAGVCAAAALSTPYILDYDQAVVGLGAAFLYSEASREGFLPYERTAIAGIWIIPWFSRSTAELLSIPLALIATLLLASVVMRRIGLTASPSRR